MGSARHCAEAHPCLLGLCIAEPTLSAWEEKRRLRFRIISRHEDGDELVRLGHEPHGLPPPLEHQRRRLALVGAHPMGALHALAEPPRARRPPPGGIVAPQYQRRTLLRGLHGGHGQPACPGRVGRSPRDSSPTHRSSVRTRSPRRVHSYSKKPGASRASPRRPSATATNRCAGAVATGVSSGYSAARITTAGRATDPNGAPATAGTPASCVGTRARNRCHVAWLSMSRIQRTTGLSACSITTNRI